MDFITGIPFTLIYDGFKLALTNIKTFKKQSAKLEHTLQLMNPSTIEKIGEQNRKLKLQNDDVSLLMVKMDEGTQLLKRMASVSSLDIHVWGCGNSYAVALEDLDKEINILMARIMADAAVSTRQLVIDVNPLQEQPSNDDSLLQALPTEGLQIIKKSELGELRLLGPGNYGEIYLGKWRGFDVAAIRIGGECFAGKNHKKTVKKKKNFWNAVRSLAKLDCPTVVKFHGVILDGLQGGVAIVTDYIDGSLRNFLQQNDKSLETHERLLIARDLASGMDYLLQKNIAHIDLTSDSILVNVQDPQRPCCRICYYGLLAGVRGGDLTLMAAEGRRSHAVIFKDALLAYGAILNELLYIYKEDIPIPWCMVELMIYCRYPEADLQFPGHLTFALIEKECSDILDVFEVRSEIDEILEGEMLRYKKVRY